jgi:hypothetical protein
MVAPVITRSEAGDRRLCLWGDGKPWPKETIQLEPVCGARRLPGSCYCAEHEPLMCSSAQVADLKGIARMFGAPKTPAPAKKVSRFVGLSQWT